MDINLSYCQGCKRVTGDKPDGTCWRPDCKTKKDGTKKPNLFKRLINKLI